MLFLTSFDIQSHFLKGQTVVAFGHNSELLNQHSQEKQAEVAFHHEVNNTSYIVKIKHKNLKKNKI